MGLNLASDDCRTCGQILAAGFYNAAPAWLATPSIDVEFRAMTVAIPRDLRAAKVKFY
jgi:hypothetical protein